MVSSDGDTLNGPIVWGSLDPAVATVSAEGLIRGDASGQARIVAIYAGVAAERTINVVSAREIVEYAIGSAYQMWFAGHYSYNGPGLFLSNAAFQHSAPWANSGMEVNARLPRVALPNSAGEEYTRRTWDASISSLRSVAAGLEELALPETRAQFAPEEIPIYDAFAAFVKGVVYGSMAVLYDRGPVLNGVATEPTLVPYPELADSAYAWLGTAIQAAETASFVLPYSWIQAQVSAEDLARIAHSLRARFRAATARTPEERATVDWIAVLTDVDLGVTQDFVQYMDPNSGWYMEVLDYGTYPGWSESPYFIYGMGDQSGAYQGWLAQPLMERRPDLPDGTPVLIQTPDQRFPNGATVAEQQVNHGRYFQSPLSITDVWARPDRGTWRWSYYKDERYSSYYTWSSFYHNEIDIVEMQLLKAEALYRNGDLQGAAELVNLSRTAAGLNPTDANGTNTSCVPKLPDGRCGDLFEMLKWEKRIEVNFEGLFGAPWFFDARGWGDLYYGTYLHVPVPCSVLTALGEPCYTFGGGSESSAGMSTYGWPGEAP